MKNVKQVVFAVLRTGIGVALVWYLWRSGAINWTALAGMLTSWKLSLAAFGLLLVDVGLVGWRLTVLLGPRGFHLPIASAFRLTLIGVFFNACLPGATGGDLVKIYYAAEGNPGRKTEVATIVLLDRAVGMFGFMALPLLLLPFFPELLEKSAALRAVMWAVAGVAATMIAGTLACFSTWIRKSTPVEWTIRKLPLGRYVGIMYDTVHAYREHPGPLLGAVGISLGAHMLAASVAMLASLATHPNEFAGKMSVLIPIGFTVNVLPVTPGGLGVGEAAFEKLFSLAGLTGGADALLGWRLLTILMSLLGLAFYLQGRKRFVHDVEEMEAAEKPVPEDA